MAIRIFESSGEAYDACQCDDSIKKGDLLVIPSEDVVGLAGIWPIAITANNGQLHKLTDGGDSALVKWLTEAE
jgi:hypothetical protein